MTQTAGLHLLASAASERIFIVKADDFGRGPVLDRWRKFFDLCIDAGVIPSMGVVGADFSRNTSARALARFASQNYGCEFWNHSNTHVDLRTMTRSARIEDTTRCHDVIAEAIGIAPIAYGAPFNFIDAECARDVMEGAPYRLLFDEAALGRLWELPRDWYVTPEVRTQAFRPVRFQKFASAMERRWSGVEAPPIVIQVHPSYWSDDCFDEFARTIQLLFEFGYEPFTVSQFVDYLDVQATTGTRRLTLGAAAFAARKCGRRLMRVAGHLRRYPVRDPRDAPGVGLALAEVGQGAGSWALAACATDSSVRAVVIEEDDGSGSIHEAGQDFIEAGVLSIVSKPPGRQTVDVFIADDPQASWETTLGGVGLALRASGRALVRRESEIALFQGVRDAAARKDRASVLSSIEAAVRLAGRRLGIVAPASAPRHVNDVEFSMIARYAGLQPQLRSVASRWASSKFAGASLVVEDLLICTEDSQRRASHFAAAAQISAEDASVLACAGACRLLGPFGVGDAARKLGPELLARLSVTIGEDLASASRIDGEDTGVLAEFARLVRAEAWREASDLAASQSLPVPEAGKQILRWLGGAEAPRDAEDAAGGLITALMQAGARLRAGDDAFADITAALTPSKRLERHFLELQAGPSPENIYPFVDEDVELSRGAGLGDA